MSDDYIENSDCSKKNEQDTSIFQLPVSDGGQSELDRIFAALMHARRRYVLYSLIENERSTLDEVTTDVAVRQYDCEPGAIPEDIRSEVKADLYHHHLPKLANCKIIEYDERTGDIRFREPPEKLTHFLDLTASLEEE